MKNFETIKGELEAADITPEMLSDAVHALDWAKKYPMPDRKQSEKTLAVLAITGALDMVEHYGGEGEGETWYDVIHFVEHGFYMQIDGYYQSYDGTDFSSAKFREVKPETITKVVYK